MKIAIISDIHGNLPALEAVIHDIRSNGADQIICLGDISNLGPFPRQCLDLVLDLDCPLVQGNHELYVLGQGLTEDWESCPTWSPLRWTRSQMTPLHFNAIAAMPVKQEVGDINDGGAVFVHGSPKSPFLGINGAKSDEEILEIMEGIDNTTLFCGHTHTPLLRQWSKSRLINVGSVGMPLDGHPNAQYVMATKRQDRWQIEFRYIEYDINKTMTEFDVSGLQASGGAITAAFRYQMLTGNVFILKYFNALRSYAEEIGQSVGEAYHRCPVPTEIQQWVQCTPS